MVPSPDEENNEENVTTANPNKRHIWLGSLEEKLSESVGREHIPDASDVPGRMHGLGDYLNEAAGEALVRKRMREEERSHNEEK